MWEIFLTQKYSPKGHSWGTQGPDLRRGRIEYFQILKSSLFGTYMTSLYHWIPSPHEKILQTFPPDVGGNTGLFFEHFSVNPLRQKFPVKSVFGKFLNSFENFT